MIPVPPRRLLLEFSILSVLFLANFLSSLSTIGTHQGPILIVNASLFFGTVKDAVVLLLLAAIASLWITAVFTHSENLWKPSAEGKGKFVSAFTLFIIGTSFVLLVTSYHLLAPTTLFNLTNPIISFSENTAATLFLFMFGTALSLLALGFMAFIRNEMQTRISRFCSRLCKEFGVVLIFVGLLIPIVTATYSAITFAFLEAPTYVSPQGAWIFPYADHGIVLIATGLAYVSASAVISKIPSKGGKFNSLYLGLGGALVLLWFFSFSELVQTSLLYVFGFLTILFLAEAVQHFVSIARGQMY